MPSLEYADSPLTTGSPLLSFAEPALFLMSPALGAFGGVVGEQVAVAGALVIHFVGGFYSAQGETKAQEMGVKRVSI